MHSYYVMGLVSELMDCDPAQLITDDKIRSSCFVDTDPYWQLFKSANATAAKYDLEEQITDFQEEQAEFTKLQSKMQAQGATAEDMRELTQKHGGIQQRVGWFNEHRKLLNRLQQLMAEKGIEEVIEIEQDIISGIDQDRSEPINPDQVLKRVQTYLKGNTGNPEFMMRVIALFITYYEVPDKIYQDLA